VSLFVFVGKFAGAFKEMAIAYRYGISPMVDAYQFTYAMMMWLPSVLVAVLSVILIPALVGLRDDLAGRRLFVKELGGTALITGAVLSVGLAAAWSFLAPVLGRGMAPETLVLSRHFAWGLAPSGLCTVLICVYAARLQARERHINTLLECVPAATLLIWLLCTDTVQSTTPLVWGTSLGFILQAILLARLARCADGVTASPSFSLRAPQWSVLYKATGVFMAGQIVMSLVTPLDQYTAAQLGGGTIASLGYANRLLMLATSLGALAIGRATLPVFSDILRRGESATPTALKWAIVMFVVGLLAAIAGALLSECGTRLVFQHGAFSASDTARVAHLLRWGLTQLPFYFSVLVLVQLLAAQGRYGAMSLIAVGNFLVKLLGNMVLVKLVGEAGIMLANTLMQFTSLVCYSILIRKVTK
jgi:peptidoglycan biosynthesis protein MviN/MurJ (putative lipid II flippase)